MPVSDVFSLIVGIDKYLNTGTDGFTELKGAVNDAKAFEAFLLDQKEGLGVLPSHIVFLRDGQATRAEIMAKFQSHLLNNEDIPERGATMIFFFAGHGARMTMDGNESSSDSKVEVICPVDERTYTDGNRNGGTVNGLVDHPGSNSNYVHAIPDYVLGQLLKMLAMRKGDNITVILDSCHSAGMARDKNTEKKTFGRSRSATTNSCPVPESLDKHLWGDGPNTERLRAWAPYSAYHVQLAACSQYGSAYESIQVPYRGLFSERLIPALRDAVRENPPKRTYVDLLNSLPELPNQIPFCGGTNKDRLVFTTLCPTTGVLTLTKLPSAPSKPSFSVAIGSVEGVCPGTEFSVRATDDSLVCTLIAQTVSIRQSILGFERDEAVEIPEGSRVRVKDWKNKAMVLKVHDPSRLSESATPTDALIQARYMPVESSETADVALLDSGGKIIVQQLSGILQGTAVELPMPEKDGKTLHLPTVLNGIAHFHYFLEHHNGDVLKRAEVVSMFPWFNLMRRGNARPEFEFALEMHRLKGEYPQRSPDRTVSNMIKANKVHFRWEEGAWYGFTIRNNSNVDLFPYLFYFDPDDYTIECYYKPENLRDPAPLHNKRAVTAGLGGDPAFHFRLRTEQAESSGFLKLFVSTEPLDLAWIEQTKSPFAPDFPGIGRLAGGREVLQKKEEWNALHVVVTMTK
ncbi:hypothetical protein DFH07DRAFT_1066089 [Mycena maculata]|uniref:Peptidase C14 caspase domain-containing protein n=1 Tax=Mycena maculata TaxID=230809 RepID=A0AAD7HWN2_9AGAR|nr:hypothetical protein DFH07DRAFT_1066089 [Mycena maculata]